MVARGAAWSELQAAGQRLRSTFGSAPRPETEPSSSFEAPNLARDLMTILTCHLLHSDCMTRTDDISGLLHTSAKYALMTSADFDDISGLMHTFAKYARPLISTPNVR